jgi:hypothetical protein
MKQFIASVTIGTCLLLPTGGAFGANPHSAGGTGQPSQSCQNPTTPVTPGNAAAAAGSPFGGGIADQHYAGNPGTASLLHAQSSHAVSQYDVACFQNSQVP